MAHKIYDQPLNRAQLADVATVLLFVCRTLRHDLSDDSFGRLGWPDARRMLGRVVACEQRLLHLGRHWQTSSEPALVRTVDDVMHKLVSVLAVLEEGQTHGHDRDE